MMTALVAMDVISITCYMQLASKHREAIMWGGVDTSHARAEPQAQHQPNGSQSRVEATMP